jgi:hypothetical protein
MRGEIDEAFLLNKIHLCLKASYGEKITQLISTYIFLISPYDGRN